MRTGQNYLSFLLRAWKEHEGAEWRFSIQETTGDQQQHFFRDFNGLVRFLADLLPVESTETGGNENSDPETTQTK